MKSIAIKFELKNISGEQLLINKVMAPAGNLFYEFENAATKEVILREWALNYYWAHWRSTKAGYMIYLEPDESIQKAMHFSLSSPGTFHIKARLEVYAQSSENKTDLLCELTSPAISIRVLKKK